MTNRLADSASPYLQQHAGNPIDWWPWTADAFEQARERDLPILLSVGYAACHWCHVMAHESFEDPATAAVLNRDFVSIKVDREERPDVDAVYMAALQGLTGHGGWPMSVFLNHHQQPFHAGTYYPVLLAALPVFESMLSGQVHWPQRGALCILRDLFASFEPEPGFETVCQHDVQTDAELTFRSVVR